MNNVELLQSFLACQYDIENAALIALKPHAANALRIIEVQARMDEIKRQIDLIEQKL